MDSKESMREDELSALLQKWKVDVAPLNLETRVFRARLRIRLWRPIAAVSFALAVIAASGAWILTSRSPTPVAVKARPFLPNSVSSEATPSHVNSAAITQPQAASFPADHEGTQAEIFQNRYQATPHITKPTSQIEPPEVQELSDITGPGPIFRIGNGVSSPSVLERQDPQYSDEARAARLVGKSVLSLVVDKNGNAQNIRVMRSLGLGLDEKAVEAVKHWKFKPGLREGTPVAVASTIEVNFNLQALGRWRLTRAFFMLHDGGTRPVLLQAAYPSDLGSNLNDSVFVSFDVDTNGIPINLRAQSVAGPKLENEAIAIVSSWLFQPGTKDGNPASVSATFGFSHTINGEAGTTRLRVGKRVQEANLVRNVQPEYPREAKSGGVEGEVKLQVRIDGDGHVSEATVISGNPLLTVAAIEAVKQWLYRPTLLNGIPVEVETEVDVDFVLSK